MFQKLGFVETGLLKLFSSVWSKILDTIFRIGRDYTTLSWIRNTECFTNVTKQEPILPINKIYATLIFDNSDWLKSFNRQPIRIRKKFPRNVKHQRCLVLP